MSTVVSMLFIVYIWSLDELCSDLPTVMPTVCCMCIYDPCLVEPCHSCWLVSEAFATSYVHTCVCRTLFPILPLYVYYSSVAFTPLTFLVGMHVPVRMNGTCLLIGGYMVLWVLPRAIIHMCYHIICTSFWCTSFAIFITLHTLTC